jgi:hypothetical protein
MVKRRPGSNPGTNTVWRPANLSGQQWLVDPEYYWFQTCDCAPVSVTKGCNPCRDMCVAAVRDAEGPGL